MGRHRLKLHDLTRILGHFGVGVKAARGKGSHVVFWKEIKGGIYTYPVPNENDVLPCYVKQCRKKFLLREEDGVSDEEFFGGR